MCFSSDKEQLAEEEDDELKEVLDLRKIAVQLLQQEQQNRCVRVCFSVCVFSFTATFSHRSADNTMKKCIPENVILSYYLFAKNFP